MAAERGSRDRFPGLRESCRYLLAFSLAARTAATRRHTRAKLCTHVREYIAAHAYIRIYVHVCIRVCMYSRADLRVEQHIGRLCVGLTTGAGIIRDSRKTVIFKIPSFYFLFRTFDSLTRIVSDISVFKPDSFRDRKVRLKYLRERPKETWVLACFKCKSFQFFNRIFSFFNEAATIIISYTLRSLLNYIPFLFYLRETY